jgi:ABC-type transport system involved in multi-copper enzyme maturation permease subunit
VNPTLFLTALRQRFTSPIRLILVAAMFTFPFLLLAIAPAIGLHAIQTGTPYAFLLGAGLIGQETSSGVMQLLFARPVRRWEYVTSRWLAIAAAITALVIVQIAIASLILMARGNAPDLRDALTSVVEQVLPALGTLSALVLFSSFLSGIGDVAAVVLAFVTSQVLQAVGQFTRHPSVVRVGQEVTRFLAPQLPIGQIHDLGSVPWFELVSYLSTVSLCLAVAVVLINRREISYASE